jgi:hypothetical protein
MPTPPERRSREPAVSVPRSRWGDVRAFTTADVLFLMQPENWRIDDSTELSGYQNVAAVALAATARIGRIVACTFNLKVWQKGAINVHASSGRAGPIFLPVAQKAIADMIKKRPKVSCDALFVSRDGTRTLPNNINRSMRQMGWQCANAWKYDLTERLFEYFDRCFDGVDDRAAVAALMRRRPAGDADLAVAEIDEAAADEKRLLKVLEAHPLAGPAREFLGARGIAKADEGPRTVFRSECFCPQLSEDVLNDPVCKILLNTAWGITGHLRLRQKLKKLHFSHIDRMLFEKRISVRVIAYLFNVKHLQTVRIWSSRHRRSLRNEAEKVAEERWKAEAIRLWRLRKRGMTLATFHARLAGEYSDFGFSYAWLMAILQHAKLL